MLKDCPKYYHVKYRTTGEKMSYKIKTLWKSVNHKYTQVVQERKEERHTERMCT